jgi:hypothetical protein
MDVTVFSLQGQQCGNEQKKCKGNHTLLTHRRDARAHHSSTPGASGEKEIGRGDGRHVVLRTTCACADNRAAPWDGYLITVMAADTATNSDARRGVTGTPLNPSGNSSGMKAVDRLPARQQGAY